MRCWFAPESLQTGEKFKASIDNAIRRYEKFLVVLSKHALKSGWVQHELEVALQKEHHGKPSVIYPLRLDGAITNSQTGGQRIFKATGISGVLRTGNKMLSTTRLLSNCFAISKTRNSPRH